MSRYEQLVTILNNNTKTVFKPDTDKDRAIKESIANGTFEGPDSIEDIIDNIKEENLNE